MEVRREVVCETEEQQAGIERRIQSRRGREPKRPTGKETRRVARIVLVPASMGAGSPLSAEKRFERILFFFYAICNYPATSLSVKSHLRLRNANHSLARNRSMCKSNQLSKERRRALTLNRSRAIDARLVPLYAIHYFTL